MIQREDSLPVTKQRHVLQLSRSSVYYIPIPVSDKDRQFMRIIDEVHFEEPYLGLMGLEALYKKPHPRHKICPLPSPRTQYYKSQFCVVFRHQLCSNGKWFLLSCSCHGLGKKKSIVMTGDGISIYSLPLHFEERIIGSYGGESNPTVDIPNYINLYKKAA